MNDVWGVARRSARVLAGVGALALGSACSQQHDDHASAPGHHAHAHVAPHGGTTVVLGHDAYHLELVFDAARGVLQAYVLDGEIENFVRIAASEFEVVADVGDERRGLFFKAVSDAATGEKVGDTSLFEAAAEWVKTTPEFDATLTSLTIRGTSFSKVSFNFPHGNEHH